MIKLIGHKLFHDYHKFHAISFLFRETREIDMIFTHPGKTHYILLFPRNTKRKMAPFILTIKTRKASIVMTMRCTRFLFTNDKDIFKEWVIKASVA